MVCLQEARELFKDPEVEAADEVEVGRQIYSEIYTRVLFSRNFANTKFFKNKTLTK